jgi:hypothetical protein
MYPEDFDETVISDLADLQSLSDSDQVAVCLHRLEAEVNNGGFHQFFSNVGFLLPYTQSALTAIGATKTAMLLDRAAALSFPGGYPADPEMVDSALADFDDVDEELESLDQAFLRYEDPLTDMVNAFLAKNH